MLLHRFIPAAAATLGGSGNQRWDDRRAIMAGARNFAASKAGLVDLRFTNTQIALSGHSALVRSTYQTVVERNGTRDTTRGRATELFVRLGTTWVNPYWQLEPGVAGVEREIVMPDTTGARCDIVDSAAYRGTVQDYDRLVGTWEFRFQPRGSDGAFYAAFPGHWTFEKRPGGGLVEDRWRPDDPSEPMGRSLYTYRTFDSTRKVWQMMGSQSVGGEIQPGLTWRDGDDLCALQRSKQGLVRIRYRFLDDDHFLWRSDYSPDGGKTWVLDGALMEARRIGK